MRSNRMPLGVVLLLATLPPAAVAVTVAGITPPDSVAMEGITLPLNGAGKRVRFGFVDVYVAALYVRVRTSDAERVLADPGPKRLELTSLRSLTPDQLGEALRDGLHAGNDAAAYSALAPRIEALLALMRSIGVVPKGDTITLDFLADGTTRVADSAHPQGKPIAGADFQRALLGIWLGAKPVQADLKQALLGLPP